MVSMLGRLHELEERGLLLVGAEKLKLEALCTIADALKLIASTTYYVANTNQKGEEER